MSEKTLSEQARELADAVPSATFSSADALLVRCQDFLRALADENDALRKELEGIRSGESVKAARQKYLQLGREIESLSIGSERENLMHTHSKLGIFLDECFGSSAWRGEERD